MIVYFFDDTNWFEFKKCGVYVINLFLVIKQLLILGHPNNFISIKIVVQLLWPSLSLNGF
jgi:hypothetical protein